MDVHGNPLIRGWRFPLCWTAVDDFGGGLGIKAMLIAPENTVFPDRMTAQSEASDLLSVHFPTLTTCSFDSDSAGRQTVFSTTKGR